MKIGVDLGGTNVRMGIVENGTILKKIAEPCKANQSEKEVLDHLISMIHQLMSPEIKSIGIGVPSVVDTERGIVYDVANIPAWKEVHLKEILEKEFNIPVAVNNDCNCFVLGEHYCGEGKPYKNIVGVAFGTGVGSGIIIDDKLYCGDNAGAGEIGCIPYLDSDYEHYCASFFFLNRGTTGREAFEKASAGDVEALKLWEEVGFHIGNMMKVVLYAYDPQAIVIGGSISRGYQFFSKKMYESMSSFPFSETVKKIKIHLSTKDDIGLLGASNLI